MKTEKSLKVPFLKSLTLLNGRRTGSAEDPWISLNDHWDELQRVAFTATTVQNTHDVEFHSGASELSPGHFNFPELHSHINFIWNGGGADTSIPEYNFEIRLTVKITGGTQTTGGLFEIIGVRNGGGHDRHIGIRGGLPYFRTWAGHGYYGDFNGIDVFDGQFHEWKLNVQSGLGQVATIDGVVVATSSYDHSDFHWSDTVRLGHSSDMGHFSGGEIKDVEIVDLSLGEGGNGFVYAENNFDWATHTGNLLMNGGADVYVRDYAAIIADDEESGIRLTWLFAISTLLLFLIVF